MAEFVKTCNDCGWRCGAMDICAAVTSVIAAEVMDDTSEHTGCGNDCPHAAAEREDMQRVANGVLTALADAGYAVVEVTQ